MVTVLFIVCKFWLVHGLGIVSCCGPYTYDRFSVSREGRMRWMIIISGPVVSG